jgi:hypothetical protein
MGMTSIFNYERLLETIKYTPPYRGTTNEYPVWDRNQSYKRMKAVEVTNDRGEKEVEFHIHYGYSYTYSTITKEEHEGIIASKVKWPRTYAMDSQKDDGTIVREYHKTSRSYNRIGIVRSDNTFEFVDNIDMHQGVRMFLSRSGCVLRMSSRHGGVVISKGWRSVDVPVFAGLRIYMDTLMPHPTSDYEITRMSVNRSAGAKELKKYEKAFTVAEVMLSAIDTESFIAQAKELTDEVYESILVEGSKPVGSYYYYEKEFENALRKKIPQVIATQVKEKFGTLNFYFEGGDDYIELAGRTFVRIGRKPPGTS